MPIKDLKFAEGNFTGKDVASLPDNPSAEGISAAQLKARFDNVGKVMVALGKYNELIDALTAQTGAGEIGTAAIGGVDGANVQETLAGLKALDDANKEELKELIGQRVAKTDVVQMRGRSETQVMSQRAVTDAIDAGGGGGAGGGEFEPVGCMKFYAGETLPDGYLWCDGQSYPANGIYKKLFDVIGTAYNQTDDAEGTFRVPDMRGRVGVGKNAGTFDTVGKTGGEEAVTLTSVQSGLRAHGHPIAYPAGCDGMVLTRTGAAGGHIAATSGVALSTGMPSINNVAATDAIDSHENMPPYLVCNYIIKYDRSYEQIGVTAPPVIWDFAACEWQEQDGGGYVLSIPESEHRRGQYCVLTALYDTTEAGKLKAVLFEMEKNEAGDITIYSDSAFTGKAYIDRVYMASAGRVLSVNGQTPDMDGDVNIDADIFDKVYPVGSIYMSVNNVNPAALFGGTWEAWGAGRMPVGVDAAQSEFDTVEKTGGAKTVTLTGNQIPSVGLQVQGSQYHYGGTTGGAGINAGTYGANVSDGPKVTTLGGGQAHNNLQPYITCYMWKRTA
ncbi:hypothetical protein CE91St36_07410 [Christensenellaceae bacterium]|nr:hypothetical protein CE91St36_07410 [Christensenellaceae bacterium]BDF60592.1 hypothetical protein CE91St37_07420 [Christensenellaceae bacterium]